MLFDFFQKKQSFIKIIIIYSLLLNIVFNWQVLEFIDNYFDKSKTHGELFEYFYIFLVFLFLSITTIIFFSIFGFRYFLKPLIFAILIISSVNFYFFKNFGTIMNDVMISSFWDAIIENNIIEIKDLITSKLILHILILGIFPALPLLLIKIDYPKIIKEYSLRLALCLVPILTFFLIIIFNYKDIVITTRSLKDFDFNNRFIPQYLISSNFKIIKKTLNKNKEFKFLDNKPSFKNNNNEIVGLVVVGETARSYNHSLNGYHKKTNPLLEKESLYNYSNVTSCGTLTNVSVPCMFYLGKYENYSPEKARYESNVLLISNLAGAGIYWIENNSSCKHVCEQGSVTLIDPFRTLPNLENRPEHINNKKILEKGLHDYELIEYAKSILQKNRNKKKILIVLHIMGSHGPSYYDRYPKNFEIFVPSCKKNQPQECSKEELTNSYDNTILYTDYVIKGLIDLLKSQNKESFLLYASDHGESLGENGIYLHGLPRAIAPKEQIHIPLFFWLSEEYKKNYSFNVLNSNKEISHEYFPHTILELMRINSKTLNKDKSLIRIK